MHHYIQLYTLKIRHYGNVSVSVCFMFLCSVFCGFCTVLGIYTVQLQVCSSFQSAVCILDSVQWAVYRIVKKCIVLYIWCALVTRILRRSHPRPFIRCSREKFFPENWKMSTIERFCNCQTGRQSVGRSHPSMFQQGDKMRQTVWWVQKYSPVMSY